MFYKYKVMRINDEDVMYLYLTASYEFSSDLTNTNISKRVNNYINNSGIKFRGNKIFLVIDGIIAGNLYYDQSSETISNNVSKIVPINTSKVEVLEEVDTKKIDFYDSEMLIKLELEDKSVIVLTLEDYLIGTVGYEIPIHYEMEALKAQVVMARTYAIKEMFNKKKIKVVNSTQLYKDPSYFKFTWGNDYYKHLNKIILAIKKTNGMYLTYNKKIIDPKFHAVSNGKTEEADSLGIGNIPYLVSLPSIWDMESSNYIKTTSKDIRDVSKLLNVTDEDLQKIVITELTKGNQVKTVKIGNKVFTGTDLRYLLNLSSNDISILINKRNIKFTTRGLGSGLGLSQYGANEMAKNNNSYINILNYYFPFTKIWKLVREVNYDKSQK